MDVEDRFKGYVRQFEQDNPRPKMDKNEWVEKVNNHPGVKDHNLKVVDRSSMAFLKIISALLLIALCILGGFFIYYVKEGQFKPYINQNIPIDAEFNNNASISLNAPISNDISLNPSTSIYLNLSINIDKIIVNNTQ